MNHQKIINFGNDFFGIEKEGESFPKGSKETPLPFNSSESEEDLRVDPQLPKEPLQLMNGSLANEKKPRINVKKTDNGMDVLINNSTFPLLRNAVRYSTATIRQYPWLLVAGLAIPTLWSMTQISQFGDGGSSLEPIIEGDGILKSNF
jgi:hypothetical protein